MHRNIEKDLLDWKGKKKRMPLLLRGARQVGKSYVVEKFGKEHFEQTVVLNFEQNPELKACFKTLDPQEIISAISLIKKVVIKEEKTLLFFDEIQECPQALVSLRYFKEQMPQIHVIAAGSLLEFILNDPEFRMPVGRVQFLYLRPLSFGEYLEATQNGQLRDYLRSIEIGDEINEAVHHQLLKLVREYFALGGMPAVVAQYLESKNLLECQSLQTAILTAYRMDFGKYAKRTPHELLETIFAKIPGLVGKWLKYSTIDPNVRSEAIKAALHKLSDAGIILPVYATSGAGLPLITHANEKKCKFVFLDVGLVKRACNLDLELLFNEDLLLLNDGIMAEQFVGQELLASTGVDEINGLFSWVREQQGSSAEIDFLIAVDTQIVPIEVKAGAIGSLRSLKLFLREKELPLGVRICENALCLEGGVLTVPFYLIEQLPRLIRACRSGKKPLFA